MTRRSRCAQKRRAAAAAPAVAVAHPLLADPWIADMVRRGVMTLPTVVDGSPPPRLPPVATLHEILTDLRASRDSR